MRHPRTTQSKPPRRSNRYIRASVVALAAISTAPAALAAPVAPVIASPAYGDVIGSSLVEVQGTASGDTDLIRVYLDGVPAADTGPINGYWTAGVSAADGPHTLRARARDVSNAWGPLSDPIAITVDTVHPAAPVITAPTNGQLVPFSTITIEGTAEPGATVTVDVSTGGTLTAVADAGGTWAAIRGFSDTTHTVQAVATDAAGNDSLPSAPVTFRVDTLDPAPPIIYTPGHGSFHKTATLTLTGSAEPGATVKVFEGVTIVMQTSATDGTWSGNATFSESSHSITARTYDTAGRVSGPTAVRTFTIDLTPPAAPVISTPRAGEVLRHEYVISGRAEPFATVELLKTNKVFARVPADGSGNWAITQTSFSGQQLLKARAVDRAGNVGPETPTIQFLVDASPPPRPTVRTPPDSIFLPTQVPRIQGSASDDIGVLAIQIEYYDLLGKEAYRVNANCDGCTDAVVDWQTTFAPFPGRYVLKVYAVDRAGNRSLPTKLIIYRL